MDLKLASIIKKNFLNIFIIVSSILLTLIILHQRESINVDGTLYIQTAAVFLQSGFKAAMAVYNWAFYPILIALFSKISHLTLLNSAYLLNTFFLTIALLMFVKIVKELGADERTQLFAAIIILLFPFINHLRDNVLREFGYLCFLLTAFFYLIRFLKTPNFFYALAWNVCIILATLFRVEASIFLVLPTILIFNTSWPIKQRLFYFLQINLILFLSVLTLIALHLINHSKSFPHYASYAWGRLPELAYKILNVFQLIPRHLHERISYNNALALLLGEEESNRNGMIFIIGGLSAILITKLLGVLNYFYTILIGYGIFSKTMPSPKIFKHIIVFAILINLVVVSLFLLFNFFISHRFVITIAILFLLWAPFGLNHLFLHHKKFFGLACFFLLVMFVSSTVHFGTKKTFFIDAGNWVQNNTPAQAKIYANDRRLLFYSNHLNESVDNEKIPKLKLKGKNIWKEFDVIIIRVSKDKYAIKEQAIDILKQDPNQIFRDNRGSGIFIFINPSIQQSTK